MSNISTVYDQIDLKLKELFPLKTRVSNPYNLESNNDNLLRDGYGIKIGSADYETFEFCNFVVGRNISVVFTKELFRLDSSVDEYDNITKELLECVYETQKLFFNYEELGIEENILKVDILSSSEISSVGDKTSFLYIEANFNFSIKESF